MILIGDKMVPFEKFAFISSLEEIENTQANTVLSFRYNETILTYCNTHSLESAVVINSIKEAIYTNCLSAKYIICEKDLAIEVQKIADNYMFDSKVLAIIKSNDELEEIASFEVDGVIYRNLI